MKLRENMNLAEEEEEYFKKKMEDGTPDCCLAAYSIHPKFDGNFEIVNLFIKYLFLLLFVSFKFLDDKLTFFEKKRVRLFFKNLDERFVPVLLAFKGKDETYFSATLFEKPVAGGIGPVAWWRTAQSDNPELIPESFLRLAEELLMMPSSTAGIERIFSFMKYAKNEKRNRLGMEKVEKMCFVALNQK